MNLEDATLEDITNELGRRVNVAPADIKMGETQVTAVDKATIDPTKKLGAVLVCCVTPGGEVRAGIFGTPRDILDICGSVIQQITEADLNDLE